MSVRRGPLFAMLWSLAILAGQLWAHGLVFPVERVGGPDGPHWRMLTAAPELGWIALIAAAVVLLGRRRPRRALAAALVLVLAFLAFESTRQAVEPVPCSIHAAGGAASASAHGTVVVVGGVASVDPAPGPIGRAVEHRLLSAVGPTDTPASGRAPPARV
jgi:hypothetical protein